MQIRNILVALAIVLSGLFTYVFGQTPTWTNLGPIPFPEKTVSQVHGIGRCTQLKFHPTNANKMYTASASGGLWYSADKGVNWTSLGTDNITRVQSASVAIDPTNDQVIYWGTGDPNYYSSGVGVYKTTNGGANWTLSNSGMGNRLVIEMLFLPTDNQTLLAATNNGIYKTTNGGSSWTLKSTATAMYDMVFKPGSNGQTVYAAAAKGFYRSTDAGETWTQITSPAFVFGANGCRVGVSAASPNVVYVANVGAGTLGEMYKSTDGGNTFVNARSESAKFIAGYDASGGGQGNYNFDFEVSQTNANELYLCAHVIWRSTDGGSTWTQQQTSWAYNLHTDQHHILYDPYVPGKLWNANDGGIWSNTAQGTGAWTPMSNGIAATEIYKASSSNVNKTVNQIGTQDNGEFYSSGGLWYNNRGGDFGTPTVFDYTTNNFTYYAEKTSCGRRKLPGGGQTGIGVPFTQTVASAYGFTPALTNMGFVSDGATGLYRSVNLTATTPSWTQVGTLGASILAIGCSPTNSNVVYVFMSNGKVAVSSNAQAATPTFATYTGPVTTATAGRLEVGKNPNIAYLAVGQKVYRTKDAGATWTDISSGFPAATINGLVVDRFNPADGVYASYSLGVYYKDTTKTSWVNYSSGLPIVCNINGLMAYNDGVSNGVIRTYFYGRGVWESPMYVPTNNITVALTAPANNATFSAPANIVLTATASSTAGAITKVEFYNGTTLLNSDAASPFTYTWNGVGIGNYQLTAKAYDATGASFSSSVVNINVNLVCTSLTGTKFGTSPAYAAGSEYDKAFDGNTNTFFDYNGANGGYTGLDLGVASVINGIRFFPRAGNESRMNGGKFQGANVSDFSTGVVDLYTITSDPPSGWNETSINNATGFRYVRYLSPNGGYCNVAEIQFCGTSNQQPVVSITAPANNALYPATPATVNITATASDPDGTISKVEFYQGTTLLGSDNTSPYAFSWTGVAAGTYSLTAKAYDNTTGVTTSTAVTIIVGNQNPVVSITSPTNGASFAQPATITINATASDPDGTISKVEFYNGATLLGSDNASPYTYTWSGVTSGTYALTAKAYDNLTGIATSTVVNVTVGNQAPVVLITTPATGSTFGTPANITINALASDVDGTITKVEFYNGATLLNSDATSPFSYVWNGVAVGTYTITAKAFDNSGLTTTSAAVTFTVNSGCTATAWSASTTYVGDASLGAGNGEVVSYNGRQYRAMFWSQGASYQPDTHNGAGQAWTDLGACATPNQSPTTSITAPVNNASYTAPATVNITATAADADGTITKVDFYSGTTKIGTSTASPYTFSWTGVAVGTYELVSVATDNKGATGTSSIIKITVGAANQNPTVTLTAPLNNAVVNEGSNVTLTATASDPDGTIAKVEFFQGATLIGTSTTSPYTFTWNSVTAGTYTLTAKATDNLGGTATSTVVNLKVNKLPTIAITAPANNAVVNEGTNVAITTNAADTDGTVSKVEFYNGATLLGTVTASPWNYTITGIASGTYTLTAKVTDNNTGTATSTAVTLIVNKLPVVAITAPANNTTVNAGTNVTVTATATDANGTITKVEFYNGATLLGTVTTAPYTLAINNIAAGTYTFTAKATDNNGGVTTSAVITLNVNKLPTIAITAPANNAVVAVGSNVAITTNAADTDGTISKVEFYNGATLLGTVTASPWNYTITGITAGTYTLTAKATDNNGGTAMSTVVTVIANQNPTIAITAPANNAVVAVGANVTITTNAADADGTVSKVEFYNGATLLGTVTAAPWNYTITGITAGTYTLTAKATDNNGGTVTSAVVTVIVNQSPTIAITAPANNAVVTTGSNMTVTTNAADADGTIAKVEFYNGATLLGTVTASPWNYTITGIASGTYILTAKATDNRGASTTSLLVTIVANTNPTIAITAPANNAVVTVGSNVTITTNAADADGTISKVEFYNGATLLGTVTTAPFNYTITGITAGTYTLTAKATDNNGGTTTSTAVTVIANQSPTIAITAPANNATFTAGANVTITTNAADADGTIAKVEFYNGATLLGTVTASPFNYTISGIAAGTYNLTAKATDNRGASTTSAVVAIVVNTPVNQSPTVSITAPANNTVAMQGTTIAITATASDPDGTIAKVEFYNGATLLGTDNAAPYTFNITNAAPGTYTLTAKAYDDKSATASSSVITVTVKTTATIAITGPANNAVIKSGGTLNITATANDPDGAIKKVEYLIGTTVLGQSTVQPYTYTGTTPGSGTYTVTVKAYDVNGTVIATQTVTIVSNVDPVVSITAPANNAVLNAGTNLTVSANASDADGTITKVEFFNGTTSLGVDNTSPYSVVMNNITAGTYTLTAKATDNNGVVVTSSQVKVTVKGAVTLAITSPSSNSVITTGSNVNVAVTATDPDGAISKVEFYDGTTKLGETTLSPYNYTITNLTSGNHTITVKAIDVNGSVIATQSVAIIGNVNPVVSITAPANNAVLNAGTNLTVTANASDADGTITKVEFFNGTTSLGVDNTSPYSVALNNIAAGTYTLTAKATDNNGVVVTSAAVTVTVKSAATIAVTSPSDNSVVTTGSSVNVTVSANDPDNAIKKIEIYDGTTKIGEVSSSPYNYTINNLTAGNHTITVKAIDVNGNVITSQSINITGNLAPSVTLTAPANNTTVAQGSVVTLMADASDPDGTIAKVEFYNGGTLVGTSTTAPYTFNWSGLPAGTYNIAAKATDNNGVTVTSAYHILLVNQASNIVFTAPTNNSVVEVGTNVIVKVNATDVDGITKVELFDGTTKVGEVTNNPYQFTLTGVTVGDHALTVKVTDGKGFVTTSSVLNVTGKESDCAKVAWKFGSAYAIGDQASTGGKLYRAKAASINVQPGTDGGTDWTELGTCDLTTVVDDNAVDRLVQVFPNPSTGQFYISLANFKDQVLKYRVIDMTGREVAAKTVGKVDGQQMKEEVELPLVASGNYIVQIMLDNNLFTEKLVIMNKPKAR